jgi:nitroreductase
MDVFEAIKSRRSIRKYLDKPLIWDDVHKIIDAGRLAPSAGNLQNWKFVVVLDQGKREAIAEACLQQNWMITAPVHIIIVSEPDKAERHYGIRGERLYSVQNCAAAAQNMILTAQSLGLGTCWVGAFDEDMVKKIAGIPPEARPQIILTLGYPDEKPPKPIRHPVTHVLYVNKWRGFWTEPELIQAQYGPYVIRRTKEISKETGKEIKRKSKELAEKIKEKFSKKD